MSEVRAAGGVVLDNRDGVTHVLVVHRPRYDDWSLPKGKLDDGETFEAAALREIAEETGVVGRLGADLGQVAYVDHKGRPKVVRWWAVEAEAFGEPTDTDEVDEMRWVAPEDAEELLTYASDSGVVASFRATVAR